MYIGIIYVYLWVCRYACKVFGISLRTKACSAKNELSKCRPPERALLRHYHRGATSKERTSRENAKISSAQRKNHVNTGSSLLSVQKTYNYAKNDKRHCLRLNHANCHAIGPPLRNLDWWATFTTIHEYRYNGVARIFQMGICFHGGPRYPLPKIENSSYLNHNSLGGAQNQE